jgi:hypothetical protein
MRLDSRANEVSRRAGIARDSVEGPLTTGFCCGIRPSSVSTLDRRKHPPSLGVACLTPRALPRAPHPPELRCARRVKTPMPARPPTTQARNGRVPAPPAPGHERVPAPDRRYRDTKRHRVRFTPLLAPLAEDLREWFHASGRPNGERPVIPAHDGGFWNDDDWRNWRSRIWRGEDRRDNRRNVTPYPGAAPAGTRPRDLRSSFITVQVYAGVPLTTIAKQCGTSVTMIEQHYAGVIENWDGKHVPAEHQISTARQHRACESAPTNHKTATAPPAVERDLQKVGGP